MKKHFVVLVALAAVGLLGWYTYEKTLGSSGDAKPRRGNPAVAVEIAPVQVTAIHEVGLFAGSLYPLSEFSVAPKIAGRLEKILVNIGDAVSGGQLVAVLDDEEYRQEVNQAIAELEVAQANLQERQNALENAQREYERSVALREKKIASESELDAAISEYKAQQAKLKVAQAQVSQKKAALEMAKVRLAYSQIQVPGNHTSGYRVVGERYVDEGAMLAPNTPIVSILDIGTLIAVIHVIERDYTKIKPGLEAFIQTDAYPGRTFNGKIVRIAPVLKEKSREARVEIEISNQQRLLKPGMFVRVQIEFDKHENATVVPVSALVKRNGQQGVFVVDRDAKTARFVTVELGIVNGSRAEVVNPGLSGPVVTMGQHLLEDGAAILLPEESPKDSGPQKTEAIDSKQRQPSGSAERS